jgi:hypothetical protein
MRRPAAFTAVFRRAPNKSCEDASRPNQSISDMSLRMTVPKGGVTSNLEAGGTSGQSLVSDRPEDFRCLRSCRSARFKRPAAYSGFLTKQHVLHLPQRLLQGSADEAYTREHLRRRPTQRTRLCHRTGIMSRQIPYSKTRRIASPFIDPARSLPSG